MCRSLSPARISKRRASISKRRAISNKHYNNLLRRNPMTYFDALKLGISKSEIKYINYQMIIILIPIVSCDSQSSFMHHFQNPSFEYLHIWLYVFKKFLILLKPQFLKNVTRYSYPDLFSQGSCFRCTLPNILKIFW